MAQILPEVRLSIDKRVLPVILQGGALSLCTALLVACGDGGESSAAPDRLEATAAVQVVTTLYPLEYFIERVGGDQVEVINLVAPGVEAHDYEPTPSDIRRIGAADLVVYNGSGFDPWVERALAATEADGRVVVEAGRGVSEISVESGGDPHVWLDPILAADQVRLIVDGLSRADSSNSSAYEARGEALTRELADLDRRFAIGLADCRRDSFVTSHDAFGHLARRYGLEQVPITGLSPDARPSPRELARLADAIEELGVRYVMVEPIADPRLAQTLAAEVGAELLPLDPIESLTAHQDEQGEDYFSIMESNLDSLRKGLECDGQR